MKSSLPATTSSMSEALRAVIKRRHFPIEIMLTCVRWYVVGPAKFNFRPSTAFCCPVGAAETA